MTVNSTASLPSRFGDPTLSRSRRTGAFAQEVNHDFSLDAYADEPPTSLSFDI